MELPLSLGIAVRGVAARGGWRRKNLSDGEPPPTARYDGQHDVMGSSSEEEAAASPLQTISNVQVHVLRDNGSRQAWQWIANLGLGTHVIGRRQGFAQVLIEDPSVSKVHAEITVGMNAITLVHLSERDRTVIRTRTGGFPLRIHTPFTLRGRCIHVALDNETPAHIAEIYNVTMPQETQRFDVGNRTCHVTFDEVTPGDTLSPAGREKWPEEGEAAQRQAGAAAAPAAMGSSWTDSAPEAAALLKLSEGPGSDPTSARRRTAILPVGRRGGLTSNARSNTTTERTRSTGKRKRPQQVTSPP